MPRSHVLAIAAVGCLTLASGTAQAQGGEARYINPPGLSKPTGYTHVVLAADGRTVYIAGQVAYDSTGALVGAGNFRAQAERVFANLRIALASAGATFADVVKTTTYITDVANVAALREVRGKYLDPARLPANSLIPVATLARPELMLEIEAVAVLRK
jgi:enamine deaminase RidA (YjgF/YER057c/UK114 family)